VTLGTTNVAHRAAVPDPGTAPREPRPEAEFVAAWLRDNPDFLAEHPELYRVLVPPRRVHGEQFADHMAAMLSAERQRTRALETEVLSAIAAGRAGAGLAVRVRLAVLALMRAQDVIETVTQELPALMGVETCSLAAEPLARPLPNWPRAGVLPLPRGAVMRLLGNGRDGVRFHPGVEYRHLCVVPSSWADARCVPPHDLTGKDAVFPTGAAAPKLRALMDASRDVVSRAAAGVGSTATQIWLWGQGVKPQLPRFEDTYGVHSAGVSFDQSWISSRQSGAPVLSPARNTNHL